MVDVSNKHKSITVGVSSNNGNTIVTASTDTAQYWSNQSRAFANQAKDWANKLDNTVDGIEYSAKYYSELASSSVEGFEDVVANKTNEVIESGNTAVSNIESARDNAITDITNQESLSVDNVNTAGATQISNINTAGITQVANVNSAGTTQINLAKEQVTLATEQANIATQQATIATNKTSEVIASGNTALSNIATSKDNAITSITNQETTSKNNIINEGATQVGLVRQEGVARVEEILETGCIDVEYTEETSTLTFTGGGNALLSNYYTKEETNELIPDITPLATKQELQEGLDTKQDAIPDLANIREGASKGETALQSVPDEYVTETELNAKGYITSASVPTKTSQLTNDSDFINTQYIVSRGENLVTNGTGILQNNYNFSLFAFDPTDGVKSSGSFKIITSTSAQVHTDEYMPYDSSQSYNLSYYVKNSSSTETYDFLICYDMDKLPIMAYQCTYGPKGVMELTQPLKQGDTVVYVDDVSKIDTTKDNSFARGFIFWNYKSKSGFDYGVETYSRWSYMARYEYANIDTENNTITLNKPWADKAFEAGHKLSQTYAGQSYSYGNNRYFPEPGKWTLKTYTFTKSKIFTGTSYIQAAWLINYSRIDRNEFKLSTVTLSAKQDNLLSIQGYDATKMQTLKHVKGVLQWVDG